MGLFSRLFKLELKSEDRDSIGKLISLLENNASKSSTLVSNEANMQPSKVQFNSFELHATNSKSNNSELFAFTSVSDKIDMHKLKEIPYTHQEKQELMNVLSLGAQVVTFAGTIAHPANGLFKSTASINTLMQYSNGTFSSMVTNGGKIANHSGFVKAGAGCFTPMIGFQIASIITGQYYLNSITQQLNALHAKIDQLIELFEIERKAKINSAFRSLTDLASLESYTQDDLVLIQQISFGLQTLKEEYILRMSAVLNNKELFVKDNNFNKTNIKETIDNFEKSSFLYLSEYGFITEKLLFVSKIIYLKGLLGQSEFNEGILNKINKNIDMFSDNYFDKNFGAAIELFKEMENKMDTFINHQVDTADFYTDTIKTLKIQIGKSFNQIDYDKEKDDFRSFANQLILNFTQKKEFYLEIIDDDVRVYM